MILEDLWNLGGGSILSFRRVLYVVCLLLGISPASDAGEIPKSKHTLGGGFEPPLCMPRDECVPVQDFGLLVRHRWGVFTLVGSYAMYVCICLPTFLDGL